MSTNEGNIPLSTKPIKILSGSKNDGPKKSSNSWLNVKLPSLNTSPTAINSCIPTFPHRTIESIKGVRKGEKYKQLLQIVKDQINQQSYESSTNEDQPSAEPTTNEDISPADQPKDDTKAFNTTTSDINAFNTTTINLSISQTTTSNQTMASTSSHEDPFRLLLLDLSTKVNSNLSLIIDRHLDSIDITHDLERYISTNFTGTPPVCCRRTQSPSHSDRRNYRCKIKHQQYARYQPLFSTNKKRLADELFNQASPTSTFPSTSDIESTYQQLYESISPHDAGHPQKIKLSAPIYYPITTEEIKQQREQMPNKAASPDNFTVRELKNVPAFDLCIIYNIILSSCNFNNPGKYQSCIFSQIRHHMIPYLHT